MKAELAKVDHGRENLRRKITMKTKFEKLSE
jgi:hypothetical protein